MTLDDMLVMTRDRSNFSENEVFVFGTDPRYWRLKDYAVVSDDREAYPLVLMKRELAPVCQVCHGDGYTEHGGTGPAYTVGCECPLGDDQRVDYLRALVGVVRGEA